MGSGRAVEAPGFIKTKCVLHGDPWTQPGLSRGLGHPSVSPGPGLALLPPRAGEPLFVQSHLVCTPWHVLAVPWSHLGLLLGGHRGVTWSTTMGRQLEIGFNVIRGTQGSAWAHGSAKWHLLAQNLFLFCPFSFNFPYFLSPIHFVISNQFYFPWLWSFPKHPLWNLTHLHPALKTCHNKCYGVSKCPSMAPPWNYTLL